MPVYGPNASGFTLKTLENILSEMDADCRAQFGPSINTSSASVVGQLNGIFAAKCAELWQLGLAVHENGHVDGASGMPLRRLLALTGIVPSPATKSRVVATVNLNAGVTLPLGSVAAVTSTGARFVTLAAVTNGGASPANFLVDMESEELGPIRANAGTLVTQISVVSGWNSITNAADAVEGGFAESDNAIRLRQQLEIRRVGSRALGAIRAAVLDVSGVIAVNITENNTDFTVGVLSPHSIRVMIYDGTSPTATNADVAQAVFDSKSEGIETIGSVSVFPTDDLGNLSATAIKFDRAAVVPLWVAVTVVTSADFPADGAALIKQAIADYGDDVLTVASTVYLSQISAVVLGTTGVIDVSIVEVGTSFGGEVAANFVSSASQVPDLDTGRVTVTVV